MTWKIVPLGSVLTESKVESTQPDPARRITVKLYIKGVEKRPVENAIEGGTKYYIRRKGQFIYGKQNLHKGAFGIVPAELDRFESSMDIPAFDVRADCLPEWIYYFLKQGNRYLSLEGLAKGTGSKRIHPESLYAVEMPLPSIDEQREILTRIGSNETRLNQINAHLDRQQTTLANLRQSILREAVQGQLTARWRQQNEPTETGADLLKRIRTHKQQLIAAGKLRKEKPLPPITANETPFELPDGWVWCRVEEVCDFITKGTTPEKHQMAKEGNVPFLKVYNIVNQQVDFAYKPQYVSRDVHDGLLARSVVRPGDVIMNIVGPPLGKVAIVPDDFTEWNMNQAIARFRSLIPALNQFIYLLLLEGWAIRDINAVGMTGQDNISLEQCRNIKLPLPPLAEQQAIIERVAVLTGRVDALEERLSTARRTAERLRQAVLREAFAPQSEGVTSVIE